MDGPNKPATGKIVKLPHHERFEECTTRPAYRQGHKLTAVKVYTVSDESQHLLIHGVPKINLVEEVRHAFSRFGTLKLVECVQCYPSEEFKEVFHVVYKRVAAARFAKRMMDDKEFFGNILHICYAPELESFSDTSCKLNVRREEVRKRVSEKEATAAESVPETTAKPKRRKKQ